MNKGDKIYVAGHRGLVGSAIWRTLLDRGYTNLIGRSSSELDLRNAVEVREFFENERPQYVFLAAAKVGGIAANNTFRADFIYDNLQIQQNIIGDSFRCGVKKLLFLGSTCIYPRNAAQPIKESELLTSELEYTNEPYAIAKIAGIKLCESFNIQYGTNFISVMPTNLYGINDNFDFERSHVLPAIMRKIHLACMLEHGNFEAISQDLKMDRCDRGGVLCELSKYGINIDPHGVSVTLWGSGDPLREFLWSDDMAKASVFVMENIDFSDIKGDDKEIKNTHINIGSGVEVSIRNLAEMIKKEVGFGGTLRFDSSKPDGTMRKLTSVEKIHSLGWHHEVELERGIAMLYEWYKIVNVRQKNVIR